MSSSPFHVKLYLKLSSNARSDPINILSWSLGSMNTSCTCVLVSRIYEVEMTVFLKGSDCLNDENTCSGPGIWTLILTSCQRSEMKILSSCWVITYLLSLVFWTSLDMIRILGTLSMNCSSTVMDFCAYHLCLESYISFIDHSFILECGIWIETLNVYPLNGVEIETCVSS